jgi:alpha-1,2-mannosyltransferase
MSSMARRGDELADRLRAVARPWELAAFIWVPAIAIAYSCWYEFRARRALEDFGIFRGAAKLVLHGRSPFPPVDAHAFAHFDKFVYPPSTALLFAPLSVIPLGPAQVLMFLLGIVCVIAALRLLDVSDWRCYGLVVMTAPAVNTLALGAITSFLLVGVAAAWRYRSRPFICGPAAALVAVSKLFLWPLGVWLLVTRRVRTVLIFELTAVCVVLGGWAVIGFAGLRSYPRLLHVLSAVEQGTSYSPVALLHLSGSAATAASAALAVFVILAVAIASTGADGERRSFAMAIIGALLATPILWLHYFLLLVVPIALYRPRLSALWFAPLLLWLAPSTHSHGVTWRIALVLAITVLIALRTVAGDRTQPLVSWGSRLRRTRPSRVVPAARANT